MYELVRFLVFTIGISLSGVMAPGPVTAATLAAGTRSRHAGALIAVGHGIIEFPLMLVIMAGTSALLQSDAVKIGIGLLGGLFLLFMGARMLRSRDNADQAANKYAKMNPLWIGVIFSGGNPYFLVWWATAGLALATKAWQLGALAFGLFAVIHWLCDLVWLETLSQAAFRGSRLLSERSQRRVLIVCGAALVIFGLTFIGDAAKSWVYLNPTT